MIVISKRERRLWIHLKRRNKKKLGITLPKPQQANASQLARRGLATRQAIASNGISLGSCKPHFELRSRPQSWPRFGLCPRPKCWPPMLSSDVGVFCHRTLSGCRLISGQLSADVWLPIQNPQHPINIAISRFLKKCHRLTLPKPQQTHVSQWVCRGLATRYGQFQNRYFM